MSTKLTKSTSFSSSGVGSNFSPGRPTCTADPPPPNRDRRSVLKMKLRTRRISRPPSPSPPPPKGMAMRRPPVVARRSSRSGLLFPGVQRMALQPLYPARANLHLQGGLGLQHVSGGLAQRLQLLGGEMDLIHLLDAARAQHDGHAHEHAVDAVLPFQPGGAGEDLALVAEDGLHHLHHRGR